MPMPLSATVSSTDRAACGELQVPAMRTVLPSGEYLSELPIRLPSTRTIWP